MKLPSVAEGEGHFSAPVAARMAAWARGERPGGLTGRELDVLRLVAQGLSNKEIALIDKTGAVDIIGAVDSVMKTPRELYMKRAQRWLAVILLAYLVTATLFAVTTPPWQSPDEPAHYNYIAYIAANGGLPTLQADDYNQVYKDTIVGLGFPPELSIEPLRYEFHQPPLYYLGAVPFFWLADGDLLTLRLYGVLIGAGIILLTFLCLETIFPHKPLASLGATAFVALLPMHVALMGSVNNDGLAELLLVASILILLHWMRTAFHFAVADSAVQSRQKQRLLLLGGFIGLALLTKASAYILLPISSLVVGIVAWIMPSTNPGNAEEKNHCFHLDGWNRVVGQVLLVLIPALLMGLPLWWRNMVIYGSGDFLGLARHAQVVAGQPRTAEWITNEGWAAYWRRAWSFTFKSFWGVFGWMGVFMDDWVYMALLFLTGVIFIGLLWALARLTRSPSRVNLGKFQYWALGVLALLILAATASYIWYNLEFVQHQGRYLFPALLAFSTFAALGWREVLRPILSVVIGGLAATAAILLLTLTNCLGSTPNKWLILFFALIATLLLLPLLPLHRPASGRLCSLSFRLLAALSFVAWAMPFLFLFALDLIIPFVYILPELATNR